MYDVLIIGCGVIGSAMAYTLSRYQLKVCVCERFNDVANGVTKANSAILHAGFDCPPGSLEARMNLEGYGPGNLQETRCRVPGYPLVCDRL